MKLDGTNQCVEHCPERFFENNLKCKQCHLSCKTCKDSSPQGCLSCDFGSILKEGICYPQCEELHFFSTDGVCKLCDHSCKHCFGPSTNHCLSCETNYALHPFKKTCIKCCGEEQTQDGCCLCDANTVLCGKQLLSLHEKKLLPLDEMYPSHESIFVISAVSFTIIVGVLLFCLLQAKSRQQLCWKQSYERLGSTLKVNTSYGSHKNNGILSHYKDDPEESLDESDVIYTSKDGAVYRRYHFKVSDNEDEEEDEEKVCLNKKSVNV
ncbi:proprotein convertase subtilisin/kexin type 5-like [Protopterus annectens]|uniref:proprotein convertase subtilisin/kexin type 5-like n=1 Tax=Protopterus annectens TaxID=7888 RepID=UPI001CFA2C70|nr:proprotein convertase subtilisin/kexin type 5-like [Protopterus annectens]